MNRDDKTAANRPGLYMGAAASFPYTRKPFRLGLRGIALLAVCLLAAPARAATINGAARNLTAGKPAAGDEVILLTTSEPGLELDRTKTDAGGQFHFDVGGIQTPRLVCVVHQGIRHCTLARPGSVPIGVPVHDVARQLDGVRLVWDVQHFETDGDSLRVQELILVRNASNPPRTLMNDRPFEIQLPPQAQVELAMVRAEGGRTLGAKPVVSTRAGGYFFPYPLRPGDTRFALVYHLPYQGEAALQFEPLYPVEQFGVVAPDSMKLEGKSKALFQSIQEAPGVYAQATGALRAGDRLTFRISGRGRLPKVGNEALLGVGTVPKLTPAKLGAVRNNWWLLPVGAGVMLSAAVAFTCLRKRRPPRRSDTSWHWLRAR
jgi:hypothetical protein